MIVVSRSDSGISLKGHAGYAEHGKDVVCAGISTLIQSLIKSVEELTEDKIIYSMSPGKVDIKHGNLSRDAQLLIDSFFVGCELIACSYPNYVKLTKH